MLSVLEQIREILMTEFKGGKGSQEPETFFDAEDDLDKGSADASASPDKTSSVTTLGQTPSPHCAFHSALQCDW